MKCGISTACFYPEETAQAVLHLGNFFKGSTEVFLNTFSELEQDYLQRLKEISLQKSLDIVSLHPFSCGFEPFLFFTDYDGRFTDGEKLYRKYFSASNFLGAKLLVLHGDTRYRKIDMQFYAQRFMRLAAVAQEYGVILAQENVERCCCAFPENIRLLRQYTEDKVKFVLDLKQARRAGVSAQEMIEAMGVQNICHLHLSDADDTHDCLAPGEGTVDFAAIFSHFGTHIEHITKVVELYNDNFQQEEQLLQAANYIDSQIEKCCLKEEGRV